MLNKEKTMLQVFGRNQVEDVLLLSYLFAVCVWFVLVQALSTRGLSNS